MVKKNSNPLDPGTEILEIKKFAESVKVNTSIRVRNSQDISKECRAAYVSKVMSFVDLSNIKRMRIVVNSGNGAAGPTFDAIAKKMSESSNNFEFIRYLHKPDSSFPNGIPNPMLKENQNYTRKAIIHHNADLGIAFDGDFDRCFFFDESGQFLSGEYIVGLLSNLFLEKNQGSTIVHDARVIWNIENIVNKKGGRAVISRTGHAFIKQKMREFKAIYGGELSAHHYFRDFFYCDSGMIPFLLICELIGRSKKNLSDIIKDRINLYPSSGEINFKVNNKQKIFSELTKHFKPVAEKMNFDDGLSVIMKNWRFNLRGSDTEKVIRLNIEAIRDKFLVKEKVRIISKLINYSDK